MDFIDFCQAGQQFVALVYPFRKKGKKAVVSSLLPCQQNIGKILFCIDFKNDERYISGFKPLVAEATSNTACTKRY